MLCKAVHTSILLIMCITHFNLGATGLVGELLEVLGENVHLTTEPAGLRQGCLQGDGVLGVTEPGTQVRAHITVCISTTCNVLMDVFSSLQNFGC